MEANDQIMKNGKHMLEDWLNQVKADTAGMSQEDRQEYAKVHANELLVIINKMSLLYSHNGTGKPAVWYNVHTSVRELLGDKRHK